MKNRPNCLSIAGFDPSGGAGVLADIKTFEMNDCQGMAVITCNTTQTDSAFIAVDWVEVSLILTQLRLLTANYSFAAIKIGLVKDLNMLESILQILPKGIPVVWDPILKSTSGFAFHQNLDIHLIKKQCTLITPNIEELEILWGGINHFNCAQTNCSVLLKGGHAQEGRGNDVLFHAGQKITIEGESFGGISKHGTGCVLSSAITAALANGNSLYHSCVKGKRYVERFILSNESNLGYHHINS
jgi:hydroxymethylpyrimidine/phosphomethylpyrimidine kinase